MSALEPASANISSVTLFFSHPSQISSLQNLQRDKKEYPGLPEVLQVPERGVSIVKNGLK